MESPNIPANYADVLLYLRYTMHVDSSKTVMYIHTNTATAKTNAPQM
jgi:hypothetical protein